jgi:von Hippel-Lindau disease tumor supressor
MVEKGSQFSLSHGFTPKQWLQTASLVTLMCLTLGGSWAVIQLYVEPWIRMLAVGIALLIQYICLRYIDHYYQYQA